MKTGHGKAVAITTGALACALLAVAGFAFKDRIIAEYYLWRLGDDDDPSEPRIWVSYGQDVRPRTPKDEKRMADRGHVEFVGQSSRAEALAQMGRGAVPVLIKGLKHSDPKIQIRAAWALRRIGSDAVEAVPVLVDLSSPVDETQADALPDDRRFVRLAAVQALKSIRGR